jgi:hypothetical protein
MQCSKTLFQQLEESHDRARARRLKKKVKEEGGEACRHSRLLQRTMGV